MTYENADQTVNPLAYAFVGSSPTSPTITKESPHLPWFCGAAVLIKRSRGRRITPATRVAYLPRRDRPQTVATTELEHDPEKWNPVFRKDHAQTKS
jgi:hypothetical protein